MIEDYLNIITSEHRQQPKYIAMLTAYLRKLQDAQLVIEAFDLHFDLNEAIVAQLDRLGDIVGRSRILAFQPESRSALLDDDNYRLIIKAKILQHHWAGTIEDMANLFQQVFPDMQLKIIDHQNMSMEIQVTGLRDDLQLQMLNNGYVIPKPEGVRIKITFILELERQTIYLGAALQSGTEMSIYPIFSSELAASYTLPIVGYYKQGTYLSVYPKE